MSNIKIKISKVSNLTDARYFTAMGVDYLGFCCNIGAELYCAPSKIKEITDWVEGPAFVLEMDGWQSEQEIMEIIDTGLGQALHFGAFEAYNPNFSLPVFKDFILENLMGADFKNVDFPVIRTDKPFKSLTSSEINLIQATMKENKVFLDVQFDTETFEEMLHTLPAYGLILRGGQEEKTGFKSFEQLDLVFDIIENH